MAFTLPSLPYSLDALAPHLSRETLELHHGKHHQKYVDTLNDLVDGKSNDDLEDVILGADDQNGVQQRRPALEPLLLLAGHVPGRGRRTVGRAGRGHRARLRLLRRVPQGAGHEAGDALRVRVGMARARRVEAARHEHPRRRPAARSTASGRCSPSTCGSTPTTSTTRTSAPTTSPRSSTSSSTGTSSPRTSRVVLVGRLRRPPRS